MTGLRRRVLVTGAGGFVGRQALEPLRARGFEVHAVGRPQPGAEAAGCNWHMADLLDPVQVQQLMEQVAPSHLLHFAWYAVPGRYWTSEENAHWVRASLDLLTSFRAQGGHRVVMAGTCAEYDWTCAGVVTEQSPCVPATLYGRCKHELQEQLAAFSSTHGLSSAWGRIFFPFGPHERPERLVPSVIQSLLRGEDARCTHGKQVRDFLLVEDLGDAFAALLESGLEGPVNMGSGAGLSVQDFVLRIGRLLGAEERLRFGALAAPLGDPPLLVADVTRLREELHWQPAHSLEQGLERTIAWWKTQSR